MLWFYLGADNMLRLLQPIDPDLSSDVCFSAPALLLMITGLILWYTFNNLPQLLLGALQAPVDVNINHQGNTNHQGNFSLSYKLNKLT